MGEIRRIAKTKQVSKYKRKANNGPPKNTPEPKPKTVPEVPKQSPPPLPPGTEVPVVDTTLPASKKPKKV